jgi:hypothetical protein
MMYCVLDDSVEMYAFTFKHLLIHVGWENCKNYRKIVEGVYRLEKIKPWQWSANGNGSDGCQPVGINKPSCTVGYCGLNADVFYLQVRSVFMKIIVFLAHYTLQDGPCPPLSTPG